MIKSSEFDRFKELSWRFQAVDIVVKKLRANVSRIWSDIPALLRNLEGKDTFAAIFGPLYKNLQNSSVEIDRASRDYKKLLKKIILKLQKVGAFINHPYSYDLLAERVAQGSMVSKVVVDIFENVRDRFELVPTDIDITKPNVVEIYIIAQAKVDACCIFLEECRKEFNKITGVKNLVKEGSNDEFDQELIKVAERCNTAFDIFVNDINKVKEQINKQVEDLNKVLDEFLIEFSMTEERKNQIISQVRYCELYDTYKSVLNVLKPNDAFNALINKREDKERLVEVNTPTDKEVLIQSK